MEDGRKDLRVLQVTARYLPYIGGVENHVYQVSKRLVQNGVEVTVLTTDPENKLPAYETREGVKILRVRAWPAKKDFYFAPEIFPKIMQRKWDLVHIQGYHTLVPPLAMLAARRARIPYIITFHGGGHSSKLRTSFRRTQRKLLLPFLDHAERLVAVAQFEIPFYGKELNIPAQRFCLIPNGTDLVSIPFSKKASSPHKPLIVSIGRLERYKGHQDVIAAMPKVIESIPEARLWIAGSGPYEAELRDLINKSGLQDKVDIHAVAVSERERMAAELSEAALVVLLSEFETHPLSILEAVSLGIPTLVADTSGLHELAEKRLARSIPLHSSPETIAAAIIEQIRQPQKPPSFQLPTWDDCAGQLQNLYQSVVKPV